MVIKNFPIHSVGHNRFLLPEKYSTKATGAEATTTHRASEREKEIQEENERNTRRKH